jgi:2-C-methyl-D-erythritol 4-phosphate cytidylyltransferase
MAFAVIAAGGAGERLGGDEAKFESTLLGRPLVTYSLDACESATSIEGVILVVPPANLESWSLERARSMGFSKVLKTVMGGASRQESVLNGLQALEGATGVVAVHDAARPLVTAAMFDRACEIPAGLAGLITAIPVTDTVKEVAGGQVVTTLDRSVLVSVQTPQSFVYDVIVRAHLNAARDGYTGTDDSALVERDGGLVGVVEGSRENIKVTYPADLRVAEAILRRRSGK